MSGGVTRSLLDSLESAQAQGYFTRLEQLYQELPETSCQRRQACCGLLPPAAPVEMAWWLAGQRSESGKQRGGAARRLTEHFLLNAVRRLPCPWAGEDSCNIYPRRFLGCRTYGLWSPQAYKIRHEQAIEGQGRVMAAWAGLGVALPAEVAAPGPEYCRLVRVTTGPRPTDDDLEGMERRLYELSGDLPGLEYLRPWGGDLSYAVAALALGRQQALALKVSITKELLAGRDDEAEELLAQARKRARDWALSWPAR